MKKKLIKTQDNDSAAAPAEHEHKKVLDRMQGRTVPLTDENVEILASYGLTVREIASLCRCGTTTLSKHHHDAFEAGRDACKSSLRRKQVELAQAGNVTMLIWLGKNLLGQSDVNTIKGDAANPLQINTDREVLIDKLIGDRAAPKPN
jgi:hypothetical protein